MCRFCSKKGLAARFAGVVLVYVPPEAQRQRLMARDGLDAAAAAQRLAAQLPLDDKRQHSRWVIDNHGSLAHTHAQVLAVVQGMRAEGPCT